MSNFYSYPHHPSHLNSHASHNHHGGRSRRAPRIGGPHAKQQHQHQQQQFRSPRNQKEIIEPVNMTSFRRDFEAARSFDIEDDEIFCPFNLLTDDDLQSIHSSGSDRSSLSSGSPESSPLQHQLQPSSTFTLPSTAHPYTPMNYQPSQPKLHQPMAQRTRNAIPIVDPSTRAVASPPPSVSPARQMQQFVARRW